MSKRHLFFNVAIIVVPWLTLLLLGKRNLKRFWFAGAFIMLFEIVNHIYGNRKKFWKFYDKRNAFWKDELPFSIGPYMPISLWILKYTFGNFKRFVITNVISDGLFAFLLIDILKKLKIIGLNRINHIQFFIYLHYKAYLLYGIQSLYEKFRPAS